MEKKKCLVLWFVITDNGKGGLSADGWFSGDMKAHLRECPDCLSYVLESLRGFTKEVEEVCAGVEVAS